MIDRGWRCYLALEHEPEDKTWLREISALGIQIVHAERARGHFDFRCVWRVCALARRLGVTVFHCDNIHTSPLLGAFMARVPVRIWSKRSMNPDFEECRPPTFKERLALTTRLSCWLATRVVAVSKAVKDELAGLGIPPAKIVVRNNPRRLGALSPDVSREALRRQWGFSMSDTVAITIGRAVPVKGWDVLIRAFAKVAGAAPSLRLVLVGSLDAGAESGFHESLLALMDQYGLKNKVFFTGHLTEVKSALPGADIFVMSSRSEGCSSAPIEALEVGLPCIATRVGNAEEIIQDGVNGLLVPRADVDKLADALWQCCDPIARGRLAKNAVLPPTVLTLDRYAEQMVRDYEAWMPKK